jgi:non-heme chloroperoxidase
VDRQVFAGIKAALAASAHATHAYVDTWLIDFRPDLRKIDIPTLVIHSADDRILSVTATAQRLPGFIDDIRVITIDHGPYNITWTHPDEVNTGRLDHSARGSTWLLVRDDSTEDLRWPTWATR